MSAKCGAYKYRYTPYDLSTRPINDIVMDSRACENLLR